MRKIIAFTGYAGAGKDEAANALVEHRGFTKVSFAEPLRQAMESLNPIVGDRFENGPFREVHQYAVRYNEAVEKHGYTDAKARFPEIRELLQRFGTEVGRQQFGKNFWVKQAKKTIEALPCDASVVITDLRFPNELKMVKKLGGYLFSVVRPGVGAVNGHLSDVGISELPCDGFIVNNGTIEELHELTLKQIDYILDEVPDNTPPMCEFPTQACLFDFRTNETCLRH